MLWCGISTSHFLQILVVGCMVEKSSWLQDIEKKKFEKKKDCNVGIHGMIIEFISRACIVWNPSLKLE